MSWDAKTLSRIEHNEIAFVEHQRGARAALHGATLLTARVAEVPGWNFAGAVRTSDGKAGQLVDAVEAHFAGHGRPACFRLNPLTEPRGFAQALRERGYRPAVALSSMVLDGKIAPREEGVTVRRVHDTEDLVRFTETQCAGFGMPDSWRPWLDEVNARCAARAEFAYYLAELDGRPAGVSLALEAPHGVWGVYAVTTLEACRRRGVTRAIFARIAADAGDALVTLSTNLDGPAEAAFARLGFKRAMETALYTK